MTTERHSKVNRNSQINNKSYASRGANKIMTEADENHQGFNQNIANLHPGNSQSNLNRYLIPGNENDSEFNERISSLQNIVNRAPKLNLEVKFFNLDNKLQCFTARNYFKIKCPGFGKLSS